MYIGKGFTSLIEARYKEMKDLGENEDFIDFKKLGKLKIFINPEEKLKLSLLSITIGADKVYVGSN